MANITWLLAWPGNNLLLCHGSSLAMTKMYCFQGEMSHEQASLVKAWNTSRGREVVALGRELLGGNGIVADFLIAKSFCDLEAYHS